MTDAPDWAAYRAAIDSLLGQAFAWGSTDCVAVATKVTDALTRADRWAAWDGQWNDAASAQATLDAVGGLEAALLGSGAVLIDANWWQRGDWLVVPGNEEEPMDRAHVYDGQCSISAVPDDQVRAVLTVELKGLLPRAYRLPVEGG